MSSGYQQSWDPRQGPSSSAGEVPGRQEYVSLDDFYWGDFDAEFTQPEIRDEDLPVSGLGPRRWELLRASSLPSSASVGPRMTERAWEEIDQRLEGLYNFPSNERYTPPIARTDLPVAQNQSSSSIIRSKTVPTVQAAARSRMVLDDDSEEYKPEVRVRLRKRDKLKLIGTRLVGKFKKFGKGQISTVPAA